MKRYLRFQLLIIFEPVCYAMQDVRRAFKKRKATTGSQLSTTSLEAIAQKLGTASTEARVNTEFVEDARHVEYHDESAQPSVASAEGWDHEELEIELPVEAFLQFKESLAHTETGHHQAVETELEGYRESNNSIPAEFEQLHSAGEGWDVDEDLGLDIDSPGADQQAEAQHEIQVEAANPSHDSPSAGASPQQEDSQTSRPSEGATRQEYPASVPEEDAEVPDAELNKAEPVSVLHPCWAALFKAQISGGLSAAVARAIDTAEEPLMTEDEIDSLFNHALQSGGSI